MQKVQQKNIIVVETLPVNDIYDERILVRIAETMYCNHKNQQTDRIKE